MRFIKNIWLLVFATLLLYACPQSLTPQMKAEMQIMYYLRNIHTDSLYRPGDFSQMSEVTLGKEDSPMVDGAKYKILHSYNVDGEARKKEHRAIFYIAPDYKVVHVIDVE
ncbi:hypothetical protein Q0590_08730 [Rhodocytophaga aerolata]|uniref:Lipoprotein n=1 Tax=Rhodocytophaga aerolata TaxID=455078 RepID=A0ABT8R4W3_9BACT|nr:hypothetical protein [Rhodocytophaga aerolata]MDO1446333.1 hypothetical protein [Rhodocytophaga aerolata]